MGLLKNIFNSVDALAELIFTTGTTGKPKGAMLTCRGVEASAKNTKSLRAGWLYTNDLVYQDKDGFIYMLGRADDIINVGGEKVSPVIVELS